MTEEETIALGDFSESLLRDARFSALCKQFEDSHVEHLFTSSLEAKDLREFIYAQVSGLKDFLGLLVSLVEKRSAIIKARDDEANPSEAPDEPFDIYHDDLPA